MSPKANHYLEQMAELLMSNVSQEEVDEAVDRMIDHYLATPTE